MQIKCCSLSPSRAKAGFTFVEVMVASAIFFLGVSVIYSMSSQCMQMAVSARNMSLASHVLQERAETLRAAMFSGTTQTLTSGSLQSLLTRPTLSGTASTLLGSGTESITISGSASTSMTCTRAIGATTPPSITGASVDSPVTLELRLDWTEHSGGEVRSFTRTLVTVIAKTD